MRGLLKSVSAYISLCKHSFCGLLCVVFTKAGLWSLDSGLELWIGLWSDTWMEFLNDVEVYNDLFLLRIITRLE